MDKSKLEMEFKDEEGKKFSLTIDEPREDVTEVEIKAIMDDVIQKNIFHTVAGDIVSIVGAKVISLTLRLL